MEKLLFTSESVTEGEMSGMYTSDKKAYRRRNKIDDKPLKQNRRASEGDSQNGGE